jgi:hypothetical protein
LSDAAIPDGAARLTSAPTLVSQGVGNRRPTVSADEPSGLSVRLPDCRIGIAGHGSAGADSHNKRGEDVRDMRTNSIQHHQRCAGGLRLRLGIFMAVEKAAIVNARECSRNPAAPIVNSRSGFPRPLV